MTIDHTYRVELGKRLVIERTRMALTQQKVADTLNIARSALSHYENGRTDLRVDQLSILVNELHFDLEFLVRG